MQCQCPLICEVFPKANWEPWRNAPCQVVADVSLPKSRKRLFNKALPLTPVADITRTLLSLVYWRISRDKDQEKQHHSSAEEEDDEEWVRCTIRHGFSGNELAIITRKTLRELQNCRNVYRHVRELLQLAKHISLVLYFAECRTFERKWQRHEVRCDDKNSSYLSGAVLEAVVHVHP